MTAEEVIGAVSDIPSFILNDDIKLYHKYVSDLPEKSIVFDVGTGLGKSAIALALCNPLVEVVTVDNGKYPLERGWSNSLFDYEIKIIDEFKKHNAENYTFFIDEASNVVPNFSNISLFHLDGEKDVEEDLLNLIFPMVAKDGIVLMRNHDRINYSKISDFMFKSQAIEQSGKIQVRRIR